MKRWKIAVVVLIAVVAVAVLAQPLYYMASNLWVQLVGRVGVEAV